MKKKKKRKKLIMEVTCLIQIDSLFHLINVTSSQLLKVVSTGRSSIQNACFQLSAFNINSPPPPLAITFFFFLLPFCNFSSHYNSTNKLNYIKIEENKKNPLKKSNSNFLITWYCNLALFQQPGCFDSIINILFLVLFFAGWNLD